MRCSRKASADRQGNFDRVVAPAIPASHHSPFFSLPLYLLLRPSIRKTLFSVLRIHAKRLFQHASGAARVTGAYLQPLLEAAAARGVDARALARAAGLALAALDPLPDSLAAHDYIALLDAGARLAGDPHFGLHVGERVRLGTYSVYGLILLSCRDFGQAFEQTSATNSWRTTSDARS
jgi:hypothetical protein